MSKQTMVMVLSEHAEIYWNHVTREACCDGCDVVLCAMDEATEHQLWRLREHQADQMLDAGLGLTRPAEAEAWEEGFSQGYDFYPLFGRSHYTRHKPENPYTD